MIQDFDDWKVSVATPRMRKTKFTASVQEKLVMLLDQRVTQLKVTRSEAVEEAIELWLKKQSEQDEEEYFVTAAKEMNQDAQSWNSLTSESFRRTDK
jgi:metal-responsive CopG/Arc/MetJ family transcriptional regulator